MELVKKIPEKKKKLRINELSSLARIARLIWRGGRRAVLQLPRLVRGEAGHRLYYIIGTVRYGVPSSPAAPSFSATGSLELLRLVRILSYESARCTSYICLSARHSAARPASLLAGPDSSDFRLLWLSDLSGCLGTNFACSPTKTPQAEADRQQTSLRFSKGRLGPRPSIRVFFSSLTFSNVSFSSSYNLVSSLVGSLADEISPLSSNRHSSCLGRSAAPVRLQPALPTYIHMQIISIIRLRIYASAACSDTAGQATGKCLVTSNVLAVIDPEERLPTVQYFSAA
ncbi:hypothetical protein GGR52DRAFT_13814 [Hypoxylon sp. FL1284]|nr:hypothetical protein GGR52DRAFT_13814 [Hypoxylon sp. FL1284]